MNSGTSRMGHPDPQYNSHLAHYDERPDQESGDPWIRSPENR